MSILKVDTINEKTSGNGVAIPGHVVQVIDSGAITGGTTVTNTTYADTSMVNIAITPKSASNKILVTVTQNIQVWRQGGNYATGRWRILRNTGGGAYTTVYEPSSSTNGNVFLYDYGGSGVNMYNPISYTLLDSPNTAAQVIYKTQIAQGTNGGNQVTADVNAPGRMILMEIAQ